MPAVRSSRRASASARARGNLAQNGLPDEWIDLDDFARMVAAVEGVIEEWCGTPAATSQLQQFLTADDHGRCSQLAKVVCKPPRALPSPWRAPWPLYSLWLGRFEHTTGECPDRSAMLHWATISPRSGLRARGE